MRLLTVFGFLFLFFNSFAQNAIVSFDEHKVLWNGYENKISIGYPEKVTIEVDTSDVEHGSFKINAKGKNQFTIKPLGVFQQTQITFIVKDASGEIVFEEGYRVFNLPTPSIKIFGEYNGGYIGRKVDEVIIDEDYLNLDVKYSIRSFDLDIEYYGFNEPETIHIEGENLLETLKNVCDTFNITDYASFKIIAKVVNHSGIIHQISNKFYFYPETSFHPNGQISVQRTFDMNCQANGEEKYFYDNGQLNEIVCNSVDNSCFLATLKKYYRDGSIREEGKVLGNGLIQFTSYHENGRKKRQGNRTYDAGGFGGTFVGKVKHYNSKGKLTCTDVWGKDGYLISSKGDCE